MCRIHVADTSNKRALMPFDNPVGPINRRHGANLPHWTAQNSTYFVTFRLGDSLPHHVVEFYKQQRDTLLAAYRGSHQHSDKSAYEFTLGDLQQLKELFSENIERYLDAGEGSCWLNQPEIANVVQTALKFFDEQRYLLHAWAVMPNHVHVVVAPKMEWTLSSILHSWKSFTSKECNKRLGRRGEFWQAESYDHLIRGQQDFEHCVGYTLDNPRKAGLKNWKWVGRGRL
jgi:REP element-mobilizing transposase RayT